MNRENHKEADMSMRWVLACSAAVILSTGVHAKGADGESKAGAKAPATQAEPARKAPPVGNNLIGAYGSWAASLLDNRLPQLSYRNPQFQSVDDWRKKASAKAIELLSIPDMPWKPEAKVEKQFEHDGLSMEVLSWQLPYGPRTQALFMKPAGAKGRLPAVLALHDHGGIRGWGVKKITRTPEAQEPAMKDHQATYYGGAAWANEIAKRGYAVLVHDTIGFASRLTGANADGSEEIMEKALLCAGTTWAGLFFYDDQRALDYLCSRPDVDASRLACGGLSGGGLRTVMLAGLDPRIRAAFPVGFMSTWRDFALYKNHTHTWMLYVPGLPNYLDFPEILGLRVPLHTFVLNDSEDALFTLDEMKAADTILRAVYQKAGAPGNYTCSFYPGGHKFDAAMQKDAFAWLDGLMKPAPGSPPTGGK
jgi:dienelactone hydrolase